MWGRADVVLWGCGAMGKVLLSDTQWEGQIPPPPLGEFG